MSEITEFFRGVGDEAKSDVGEALRDFWSAALDGDMKQALDGLGSIPVPLSSMAHFAGLAVVEKMARGGSGVIEIGLKRADIRSVLALAASIDDMEDPDELSEAVLNLVLWALSKCFESGMHQACSMIGNGRE